MSLTIFLLFINDHVYSENKKACKSYQDLERQITELKLQLNKERKYSQELKNQLDTLLELEENINKREEQESKI